MLPFDRRPLTSKTPALKPQPITKKQRPTDGWPADFLLAGLPVAWLKHWFTPSSDFNNHDSSARMLAASVCQGIVPRLFLVSLLVFSPCLAKLVNVTIDDGYGDSRTGAQIAYSPESAWRDGRVECSGCNARPNSALLYNRTWHDNTVCHAISMSAQI